MILEISLGRCSTVDAARCSGSSFLVAIYGIWIVVVLNSAEFFIHHRTPHTFVYLSSRDKVSVHWAN